MKFIDLTGQRFGHLIVLSYSGKNSRGEIHYNCQCDCGTIKIIRGGSLTSQGLKSCADTKNCEFAFNIASNAATIHGFTKTNTNEYNIFRHIVNSGAKVKLINLTASLQLEQ